MGGDGGKGIVGSSSQGSKVRETDRLAELVLGQEAHLEGFGEGTPGRGQGGLGRQGGPGHTWPHSSVLTCPVRWPCWATGGAWQWKLECKVNHREKGGPERLKAAQSRTVRQWWWGLAFDRQGLAAGAAGGWEACAPGKLLPILSSQDTDGTSEAARPPGATAPASGPTSGQLCPGADG